MSSAFQINLFGGFHIVQGDSPLLLSAPRLQSLLAYLLLHGEAPQSRQQISFLFWPDSSEAQARANLRKALYDLRQALPDIARFLHIDDHHLYWRNDADFTLDVATFAELLAQAEQPNNVQAALEQAVTLYEGDLLPACYDDWILPERERLRQRYFTALEQLIRLLEEKGAYGDAISYARRLLQYDPLHESTYRTLMRLHVRNGNRAQALRTYHTCVTLLQQELDVAPGPETWAAYQRLLHPDSEPTALTASAPAPGGELPLVGRRWEWEALQAAWRMAASGQARFALIAGEAGIGKPQPTKCLYRYHVFS